MDRTDGHLLIREQSFPGSLESVFGFFADAANLARITPPELRFRILTPMPIEMRAGTRLEYRIVLAGVTVRWRTRILEWDPPHRFVDTQEKGPYKTWLHGHSFTAIDGGVRMRDEVRYRLPLGPIGGLAHVVVVRASLQRIFDHRFDVLARDLGSLPDGYTADERKESP